MAPNIESEATHLREKAKRDLLNLLESVRGKKNLVISRDLLGPLGLFVAFSTLKEYGVDKVFDLENNNTDNSQRNIIYLVHGENPVGVQAVADQIKNIVKNERTEHEISIFWVPRRTLVSNKILEDEGILGDVNISELPLLFLPLENDLLSLELNHGFTDLYLRQDPSPIFLASKALMHIQKRHGLFPRILGKGDNARTLANLLLRGRKELDADDNATPYTNMPSNTVDSLIIIDRDVDFATTLLTQLTYEGLIDELIGIDHNQAEVSTSVTGISTQQLRAPPTSSSSTSPAPTSRQPLKRKIVLDSTDPLYAELRATNFATVGPKLNKIARRLESDYSTKDQARGIAELRDFVNKLPAYQQEHQSLALHTNLADDISKETRTDTFNSILEVQQNIAAGTDATYQHPTIEDLIARDVPLSTILRLLCLESTIVGGLRPRDLDHFKRLILHAYGYQHLLTLDRLEKMALLVPRSSASALLSPVGGITTGAQTSNLKTNYSYLRKELRLIVEDYNESAPEDIAYTYSGYAPLSVRIVQCILQKQHLQSLRPKSPLPITPSSTGWTGFEDILKAARGPTFTYAQKAGDEKSGRAKASLGQNPTTGPGSATGAAGAAAKTVIVMFLGGITFAEVAALRFVAARLMEPASDGQQQQRNRRRLLICTTGMVGGRGVMADVIETGWLGKKGNPAVGIGRNDP